MGRRLALLAEKDHTSPWTRVSGSESAIRVKGLGGGKIGIRVELLDGREITLFVPEGDTPLQPFEFPLWRRYQIFKIAGEPHELTSAEVLLGNS